MLPILHLAAALARKPDYLWQTRTPGLPVIQVVCSEITRMQVIQIGLAVCMLAIPI